MPSVGLFFAALLFLDFFAAGLLLRGLRLLLVGSSRPSLPPSRFFRHRHASPSRCSSANGSRAVIAVARRRRTRCRARARSVRKRRTRSSCRCRRSSPRPDDAPHLHRLRIDQQRAARAVTEVAVVVGGELGSRRPSPSAAPHRNSPAALGDLHHEIATRAAARARRSAVRTEWTSTATRPVSCASGKRSDGACRSSSTMPIAGASFFPGRSSARPRARPRSSPTPSQVL